MDYINFFAFGIYPYLAGSVFLIGSWMRFDREQYGWTSSSSQLLSTSGVRLASNLFHIGIIGIFLGHLVGLLAPFSIWHAVSLSMLGKQYIAMYGGGFLGILCLIGGAMLWWRRVTNPRVRAAGRASDLFILTWLLLTLLLGLSTTFITAQHASHGNADTMMAMAQWAKSIVLFSPKPELIAEAELIFRLHLFFGMTVFLVFPFTRLVHIWSAPFGYLARAYQIVRTNRASAR
ncbi:MAG: respiratory nitrate reductase subunit gamma [Gammaproteobacteria bacterium]|nr:respiratory nitrate reductase subunit gamma [Gammaproteobacteria bacterium]MCW8840380.1 respiratory nitrate reductase subunit gamma [Gammaproteobacteria bacterium]MCW8927298.1 respiratory nitrate reductase subunit gamma [Gammaproteobacteria bacterium]MCW8958167.1 respiratory nitrate reductase subunit gamma [Gammaproteobacteria bacterium]MCW8973156.1 respiratory nitrate reductase subunit gamma [Gammaproteobacteria bacterium]